MSAAITSDEFSLWSRYIQETCGIALDKSKAYLLETRLDRLIAETNSLGFSDLFYRVKSDHSAQLRARIVDAITTNETSFFRDTAPFELLQHKLIPELIDRRSRLNHRPIPVRVWSAACSTGQEVYTIAIVLKETLGDLSAYDVRILGTDISNKAVAQASLGCYSQFEIERGMPPGLATRYFIRHQDGWKVRDEIRALASFRMMNLLQPVSMTSSYDIVFCRNVAIYFSEADKKRLFTTIRACMAREGSLIIGSTETLTGICPEFRPKRHLRAVYYDLPSAS